MGKKLFVEDIPPTIDDADLEAVFAEHGAVAKVEISRDPETGESRGFGYVEMETDEEAEGAIGGLHDQEIEGLKLQVTEAPTSGQQVVSRPEPAEPW